MNLNETHFTSIQEKKLRKMNNLTSHKIIWLKNLTVVILIEIRNSEWDRASGQNLFIESS